MTQEEKAKRYDGAINRMKHYVVDKYGCSRIKVADVFPELKESEEERIRKALLEHIKGITSWGYFLGISREQMIAWLEAQGEHANFRNKIHVGDKVTRNRDGMLVNLSQLKRVAKPAENKGEHDIGISEATKQELEDNLHKALEKETPESCHEFLNEQDELDKESEDEKIRQFLIHEVEETSDKVMSCRNMNKKAVLAWLEKQGEQKPAWSEEDETTKNNISHIIRQYDKIRKKENQPCWYVGDCLLWMQNIKDRVQPKPKQEWSMYDETILKTLIDHFEYKKEFNEAEDYDIVLWLKSLRPQSTWKPSVEEVVALEHAINCYSGISPTNANEVFILEIMKERLKNLTK